MKLNVIPTALSGAFILEPTVFGDARGFFMESYNRRDFAAATGLDVDFVQDNHSRSRRGVLRGLHYQIRQPQGKLVRVVRGAVFDVAVDIRRASPTFGCWTGTELSENNQRQFWIPPGFAEHERGIAWDDPAIGITWPLDEIGGAPLLSDKDRAAPALAQADVFD